MADGRATTLYCNYGAVQCACTTDFRPRPLHSLCGRKHSCRFKWPGWFLSKPSLAATTDHQPPARMSLAGKVVYKHATHAPCLPGSCNGALTHEHFLHDHEEPHFWGSQFVASSLVMVMSFWHTCAPCSGAFHSVRTMTHATWRLRAMCTSH